MNPADYGKVINSYKTFYDNQYPDATDCATLNTQILALKADLAGMKRPSRLDDAIGFQKCLTYVKSLIAKKTNVASLSGCLISATSPSAAMGQLVGNGVAGNTGIVGPTTSGNQAMPSIPSDNQPQEQTFIQKNKMPLIIGIGLVFVSVVIAVIRHRNKSA